MADILVRCPHCHKPVPTGLKVEWVVFSSLPPVAIPVVCAACGERHRWRREDAWIEGAARGQTSDRPLGTASGFSTSAAMDYRNSAST